MKHILILLLVVFLVGCGLTSDGNDRPEFSGPGVPLPPTEDYGVLCFTESQVGIVASAPVFEAFFSVDGGLSWESGLDPDGSSSSSCSPNTPITRELWVPPDGEIRYRFNPGESIEISTDKGQSWATAYDLTQVSWDPSSPVDEERTLVVKPGPLDAMIDPSSGNILLAMGHAGVLLHLPSGEWRWVQVGHYFNSAIDSIPNNLQVVQDESLSTMQATVPPDFEIDTKTNYVDALAFAPNGEVLAVSGFDGGVKLFDFPLANLRYWHAFGLDNRNWRLYGLAFSPDGHTLVTCGTNVDQNLMIWDVDTWSLIKAYEGYQTNALDTGLYDGRQYLGVAYSVDAQNKNQVNLFQLPDGNEHHTINVQMGNVSSVYFVPETPYLAIGGSSGAVEVWDYVLQEQLHRLEASGQMRVTTTLSDRVVALVYNSASEALIGIRADGRLTGWDLVMGEISLEVVLPIPHGWHMNTAAFSTNGRLVAVGMHNGPFLLFDTTSGELLTRQWITDGGTLQQLAFSPNSQWIAAGFTTGEVRVWQVNNLIRQD